MCRSAIPSSRVVSVGFVVAALLAGAGGRLVPGAGRVARAELLSGFETGDDLQRWSAIGKLQGQRVPVPAVDEAAAADGAVAEADGPTGSGVRLTTPGQSGFF